ncbi:hypothetical protein HN51_063724 [Arachis hypogaea]
MARYRSRSRSYSPRRRSRTPPRERKRYDDDRYGDSRSYRDRRSPLPSGLLVRNLPLDARPEDLRGPFERFGPVKDVYLPKNYYTGEPRGFGFVKYRYGEDAAEAKQQLNHTTIGGREIRIVFAEENRKTPQEMRVISRGSGRQGGSRRRNRSRSPRRRYRSYSRSPTPARDYSRSGRGKGRDREDYYSPDRSRSYSRSRSPSDGKDYRRSPHPRSRSPSDVKDYRRSHSPSDGKGYRRSPHPRSPSPRAEKDYRRSLSPRENGRSPNEKRARTPSRSKSPRGNGHSPSRSGSRSYSGSTNLKQLNKLMVSLVWRNTDLELISTLISHQDVFLEEWGLIQLGHVCGCVLYLHVGIDILANKN